MAIIRIKYEEGSNNSELDYKYVSLLLDGTMILFDTGEFTRDWFDMTKYVMINQLQFVSYSSVVDHFIMDGGSELYDSMYLRYEEEEQIWELCSEYVDDGYEFFVDKGDTPTWKELKELYNE